LSSSLWNLINLNWFCISPSLQRDYVGILNELPTSWWWSANACVQRRWRRRRKKKRA
jgi:hypothetical protein